MRWPVFLLLIMCGCSDSYGRAIVGEYKRDDDFEQGRRFGWAECRLDETERRVAELVSRMNGGY